MAIEPMGLGSVLTMVAGLFVVVGSIFAVTFVMRRLHSGPGVARDHLRVLSALQFGAKDRLVLVQVGKDQVLVGVSASGGIQRVHMLSEPVKVAVSAKAPMLQPAFARYLKLFGAQVDS